MCVCLQESCDIDAVTGEGATALHHAVRQGSASIVELLVGHGIDLMATDGSGCSALHLAMSRESIVGINDDSPEVEKVRRRGLEYGLLVACYPLQLCTLPFHAYVLLFSPFSILHRGLTNSLHLPPPPTPPLPLSSFLSDSQYTLGFTRSFDGRCCHCLLSCSRRS